MRLLLLAHVRGLLRPSYKLGVHSQVAEELTFAALSSELDAKMHEIRALMDAIVIPAIDDRTKRSKSLKDSINHLIRASSLRRYVPSDRISDMLIEAQDKRSIREMASALSMLKKTNFYDKMDEALHEVDEMMNEMPTPAKQ